MQQLTRPPAPPLNDPVECGPHRRQYRSLSLFMFIGTLVTLITGLILGTVFVAQPNNATVSRANTINPNCSLIVPPDPLSAQGLATPYQLLATNGDDGPCH